MADEAAPRVKVSYFQGRQRAILAFGGHIREVPPSIHDAGAADQSHPRDRRIGGRRWAGGHSVPEADILRRFGRSKRNFWELYRPLADEWHLYFNGGDCFEMVASGDAQRMIVHNETRLGLFKDIRVALSSAQLRAQG